MSNIQINIKNYEEFALDYLEGNLSENKRAAFDLFLSKNPLIEEELSNLLDFRVVPNELAYDEKDRLKKRTGLRGYGFVGLFAIATLVILLTGLTVLFKGDEKQSSVEDKQQSTTIAKTIEPAKLATSPNNAFEANNIVDHDTLKKESIATSAPQTTSTSSAKSIANHSIAKSTLTAETQKPATTSKHNTKTKDVITNEKTDELKIIKYQSKKTTIEQDNSNLPHQQLEDSTKKSMSENTDRSIAAGSQEQIEIDQDEKDAKTHEIAVVDRGSIAANQDMNVDTTKSLQLLSPGEIIQLEKNSDVALSKTLNESLPVITIPDEDIDDTDVIAAVESVKEDDGGRKNKKFKLRFRNLIPEQFAGLTKEEITRSLVPETFTAR